MNPSPGFLLRNFPESQTQDVLTNEKILMFCEAAEWDPPPDHHTILWKMKNRQAAMTLWMAYMFSIPWKRTNAGGGLLIRGPKRGSLKLVRGPEKVAVKTQRWGQAKDGQCWLAMMGYSLGLISYDSLIRPGTHSSVNYIITFYQYQFENGHSLCSR